MIIKKKSLLVVLMMTSCILQAADLDLKKDYKREIAFYGIRPEQARALKRDSDGTPMSESKLKDAVGKFYDRIYLLGPGFLKRLKFKAVVFKDTVYDRDGGSCQMRWTNDELFLDADLEDKSFYSCMFYLHLSSIDKSFLQRWNKLNPDGFQYEKMRGNSKQTQKKHEAILTEWDKYFVSKAALYSTELDMEQTFAYMMAKGPNAVEFAKNNSPDVLKKFELVSEILVSAKAEERGYMETLLAEDLSKLKTYVPYALSVRLEREYSGVWTSPHIDEEEMEGVEAERKIGDPVEVAGHKLNPLILALETKNNRLFDVLMKNNADPNVVNDKKVSALKLAITNNDPEQVKALLDAGAKVTQDIARAGTASGVNAEIVKMLNSYLPGVRQSGKQEKETGAVTNKPASAGLDFILHGFAVQNGVIIDADGKQKAAEPLKNTSLANAVQFVESMGKAHDPDFRVVLSKADKIENKSVSIDVNGCTIYDILSKLCTKYDLEMQVDAPNKTVMLRSGKAKNAKKNGSAKKQ